MSKSTTQLPATERWGIYHTDREYARVKGDPLRTVVEAHSKLATEEAAARLGFSEPWEHLVRPEEVKRAQWPSQPRRAPRQSLTRKPSRGIRI